MRAALDSADQLLDPAVEAGTDAQADEALEIGRDRRTQPIRAAIGHRLDRLDDQRIIEGDAEPHVVDRRPGDDLALLVARKRIALAVGHVRLNVPQPIVALEPLPFNLARMKQLARSRGGEGHKAYLCRRPAARHPSLCSTASNPR